MKRLANAAFRFDNPRVFSGNGRLGSAFSAVAHEDESSQSATSPLIVIVFSVSAAANARGTGCTALLTTAIRWSWQHKQIRPLAHLCLPMNFPADRVASEKMPHKTGGSSEPGAAALERLAPRVREGHQRARPRRAAAGRSQPSSSISRSLSRRSSSPASDAFLPNLPVFASTSRAAKTCGVVESPSLTVCTGLRVRGMLLGRLYLVASYDARGGIK